MDLTPEGVRGARFRTQGVRGYNCADVDAFVEQMAAGLAELLEQVTSFSGRAARAERQVEELKATEAALPQTLGHAGRTADDILPAATTEADGLVGGPEPRREWRPDDSQSTAVSLKASVGRDVQAEVQRLHDTRQLLQAEIDVLAQHLVSECRRARSMLNDAAATLDGTAGDRMTDAELSDDEFLAELRQAAQSTEPLGPALTDGASGDPAADGEFGQDVSEPAPRARRRRRRR